MLNYSRLLALLLSAILLLTGCQEPPLPSESIFIISADGFPEPGKQQDFLIYQMKPDFELLSQPLPINARLEVPSENGKFRTLCENISTQTRIQPRHCSFMIPSHITDAEIFLNLYSTGFTEHLLYSQKIRLNKNLCLIAARPDRQIFCGDWLNLKFAVFNPRDLRGHFKFPLRVKLTTPFGITTANRLVSSEIDGMADFTTLINANSPPGLYRVDVTAGNSNAEILLPIAGSGKKAGMLSDRLKISGVNLLSETLKSQENRAGELFSYQFPSRQRLLKNIKHGNQQLNVDYDFSSSNPGFRIIELWKNGTNLNQSELSIDNGNSSLSLPRQLPRGVPLKIKLWCIDKGKLIVDEKMTFFEIDGSENNPDFSRLKNLCGDIPIESFLNSPSLTFSNHSELSHPISSNTYLIENDEFSRTSHSTIGADNRQLHKISSYSGRAWNRFILVENEIDLSKLDFEKLKIHLSPELFYRRFIASLYQPLPDIQTLISQGEARVARFRFLNIPDQTSEREKLEGLLIPLAEFILQTSAIPQELESLYQRALNLLQNLKSLIFIPDVLLLQTKNLRSSPQSIGPTPPFLDRILSEELVNRASRTGGKIRIETSGGSFPVNLNSTVVDYRNRSEAGKSIQKLVNLRTDPVLIELIFKDSLLPR